MHINAISCGQGAPSLYLIALAGQGLIPADLVIVADTGWENDMLWNTGRRTSAAEFFELVTRPLAEQHGLSAAFVRSLRNDGTPYPAIPDYVSEKSIDIPMFGSNGGRMKQTCTDKWKVKAFNQELRRRGATSATSYLGIHLGEVHRIKPSPVQWVRKAWPLVDMRETPAHGFSPMGIGRRWDRASIETAMNELGISYLVTSQCNGCPHQDWSRWSRLLPETIDEVAELEARLGKGELFLTDERIPLKDALLLKEAKAQGGEPSLFDRSDDDSCGEYCMVG